jgi:hypothetical protein
MFPRLQQHFAKAPTALNLTIRCFKYRVKGANNANNSVNHSQLSNYLPETIKTICQEA